MTVPNVFVNGTLADANEVNENFNSLVRLNAVSNGLYSLADDTQIFNTSGTWTKPAGAKFVFVEVWGAGGSGGRFTNTSGGYATGGGGGAYTAQWFDASTLSASETITVGAGGAPVTSSIADGNPGGTSSFGTHLESGGGGGGRRNNADTRPGGVPGRIYNRITPGVGASFPSFSVSIASASGIFTAGGRGTSVGTSEVQDASSIYGGAGGGYATTATSVDGGTSLYGGDGGAGGSSGDASTAVAGAQPGGGGGGGIGVDSGAGGDGRVTVHTIL